MFRLAVLADIHGNLPALEAVLDDIQSRETPDAVWVLGDLVAFFPWLTGTIDLLRSIPNITCLMGNTDRYLVTGQRHIIPVGSREEWQRFTEALAARDESFRWMTEQLRYRDFLFLRQILAVHGVPGNDETGIHPDTPDTIIQDYLSGLKARLLLCGHTHIPMRRRYNDTLLVNPGSVGFPARCDPRAAYAWLEITGKFCKVEVVQVEYSLESVIKKLEGSSYPGAPGMIRKLRPCH
jgi:putative phosphoesterase